MKVTVSFIEGDITEWDIVWDKTAEDLYNILNSEMKKPDGVLRFTTNSGSRVLIQTDKVHFIEVSDEQVS